MCTIVQNRDIPVTGRCLVKGAHTAVYSLLLAIIYIAFISLGLPDSLVGAGWPVMHQATSRSSAGSTPPGTATAKARST